MVSIRHILALDVPGFTNALPECGQKACTKARSDPELLRNPITGIDFCARAASGHTAAPPSSVMNARRFTTRMPPVLPTERIAHLGTADCMAQP